MVEILGITWGLIYIYDWSRAVVVMKYLRMNISLNVIIFTLNKNTLLFS